MAVQTPESGAEFVLSPRKVARILAVIVLCLATASIAGQLSRFLFGHGSLHGWVRMFHVRGELTLPAWYSSSALLACALLLAVIAMSRKRANDRDARHWNVLALIFVYLSADEMAGIHEAIGATITAVFQTSGLAESAWVIPFGVLLCVFVVAYAGFLVRLPSRIRLLFVIAGSIYVGSALGLEMVSLPVREMTGGRDNVIYEALASTEDVLEMAGVVVFIYALLSYLSTQTAGIRVRVADEPSSRSIRHEQTIVHEAVHLPARALVAAPENIAAAATGPTDSAA